MLKVKTMSAEDIEFAVNITAQMDWRLKNEDFEFIMELEPEGCFVLFDNSKRIGMATTISFDKIGWFGNLIVDKDYRRKGAGSLLVQHSKGYLINQKKVETVGLYAYTHLVPFYQRLGFECNSDFVVLTGKGFPSVVKKDIRQAGKQDIEQIVDYDRTCFGASRRKLLEPILLFPDNSCYVSERRNGMLGYVIAKVYDGVAELGPLVCRQGDSAVAINLLRTVLNRLEGYEISMFVPEKGGEIVNMLTNNGFSEKFRVARMFSGTPVARSCIYLAESLERG